MDWPTAGLRSRPWAARLAARVASVPAGTRGCASAPRRATTRHQAHDHIARGGSAVGRLAEEYLPAVGEVAQLAAAGIGEATG